MRTLLTSFFVFAGASMAQAATVAHFTDSGVAQWSTGDPQSWGGSNITGNSVAFELTIDFTTTVDNLTAPVVLWEAGGTGQGSGLVLEGDELHFFAGNGNTDVASGNHGLTAGATGVQIVSVFEKGAGTGTNELLSIYVNGNLIGTGDHEANNDWAGTDSGGPGFESGTQRYASTSLFSAAAVVNYPHTGDADITFAVYRLASDGGPVDNTLANILIPEPSSALLGLLGGLALFARRRRK